MIELHIEATRSDFVEVVHGVSAAYDVTAVASHGRWAIVNMRGTRVSGVRPAGRLHFHD